MINNFRVLPRRREHCISWAMGKKPKKIDSQAALHIEKLGQKGDGIASYRDEPVFIDGALAGEDIVSDLYRGNDGKLRGKVTSADQIKHAAPERTDPICKHAWRCGGCGLQHMNDKFYRSWLEERVKSLFDRAGIAPAQQFETRFLPPNNRRRASFSALKQNTNLILGFREKRSHNILNIRECHVLHPDIFELVQEMRPYLMRILRDSRTCNIFVQMTDSGLDVVLTGEIGAKGDPDLSVHEAAADMINALPVARLSWRKREREDPELLLEKHPLKHNFAGLSVTLPSMAFLQPSKDGEGALTAAMLEGVQRHFKGRENLKIADLFSGCGTLTGALLPYGTVTAYEGDGPAVQALKMGLMRLNNGSSAMRRDLFKDALSEKECAAYDVIVMDPPRAGAKAQAAILAETMDDTPQCLIYISCNPASFARDAAILCAGDWRFDSVQIIDQFAWSDHTELCGVFVRG